MAAVCVRRLSFDADLVHAYTPVQLRLQNGAKSLDGVLEILRMRIDAETTFCAALQKMIGCSTDLISHISCTETLRSDGLDALTSDLKNEYTQRRAFLNSLKEDVQSPLHKMKEEYAAQNKYFTNQTKQNIQALKKQQTEFVKLKAKYDKLMRNSSNNNDHKKQQILVIKKKFLQQQENWKRQQHIFDSKMISTLQAMESSEYRRMNALRDGLTTWSAFITNLAANRSYDIQNLAKSMALIDVERDLQQWMRQTLKKHPKPKPNPADKEFLASPTSPTAGHFGSFPDTPQHHGYHPSQNNNLYSIVLPGLNKQPSNTTEYIQSLFKQKFGGGGGAQQQSSSVHSLENHDAMSPPSQRSTADVQMVSKS
mmetsp:Transcript_49154/g.78519  ORF Transcript_49154/g.78519 Transcript_49154/m.78519 type:complete len:368 (+) Transcript_49154:62-1165(+)